MKLIKEYYCGERTPSDEEIKESLEIVEREDCVVKLKWFIPFLIPHLINLIIYYIHIHIYI